MWDIPAHISAIQPMISTRDDTTISTSDSHVGHRGLRTNCNGYSELSAIQLPRTYFQIWDIPAHIPVIQPMISTRDDTTTTNNSQRQDKRTPSQIPPMSAQDSPTNQYNKGRISTIRIGLGTLDPRGWPWDISFQTQSQRSLRETIPRLPHNNQWADMGLNFSSMNAREH